MGSVAEDADQEEVAACAVGAPRGPVDQARAFGREMLPLVSRTFALSIEALPPGLREPVRVAYLLCRIVDTIEDDPAVAAPAREALFAEYEALVADDRRAPDGFEAQARQHRLGGDRAEARLCAGATAVFQCFRALPEAQREPMRPHLHEMSRGMGSYCRRRAESGRLRIHDLADLERYCHYVAGTVGLLLTELFVAEVEDLEPERLRTIRERAASFGIGLQLVNIARDVAEDFACGVCYLPVTSAAARGVVLDRLLAPAEREGALGLVREVCARARAHLEDACAYTLAWPPTAGAAVRRFCAVPLALALATLRAIEAGDDVLRPDRRPAIGRPAVAALVGEVIAAAGSDASLRHLLANAAGPADT